MWSEHMREADLSDTLSAARAEAPDVRSPEPAVALMTALEVLRWIAFRELGEVSRTEIEIVERWVHYCP
jgi:hypothetical protein